MDQNDGIAADLAQADLRELQRYFESNRSNLLRTEINERILTWTYAPRDSHAAERAGWMLRRMKARSILHAQKATIRALQIGNQEVMILTSLPGRGQIVLGLKSLNRFVCPYLVDDSLKSLLASLEHQRQT